MKNLLIGAFAILLVVGFVAPVQGDNQATIDVTMNPSASINITCNQASWSPSARLTENESTATDWATLTNAGDVSVLVNVSASDSTNWTLAGSPEHNQFELQMYIDTSWTDLTTSDQTFKNNLSPEGGSNTVDFGLWLYMPTTSSTASSQISTITFTATAL